MLIGHTTASPEPIVYGSEVHVVIMQRSGDRRKEGKTKKIPEPDLACHFLEEKHCNV